MSRRRSVIPRDPIWRFLAALGALFTALGLGTGWMVGAVEGDRRINLTECMLLGLALAWIAALVSARLMRRGLVSHLEALAGHLRALGRGEFEAEPPDIGGDGLFGRTAEGLAVLGAFLKDSATGLRGAASEVGRHSGVLSTAAQEMNVASQEITSTVQQISRGMEVQAARASETSTVVAGMGQTSHEVAERAAGVAEASAQAFQSALKGGEAVKEAVHRISEISAKAGEDARTVEGLGRTSRKIGQVVQIITGIADQTNLLALNAAIEAARAGEAGRGFAVVAEEVRKLAEGSAKAAEEINQLVRDIQGETERSVSRMAEGAAALKDGSSVVTRAGAALEEIIRSVRKVDELAREIHEMTGRQQDSTERIVKAVEESAAVAEETSAGIEQASASTQEQTSSMHEMVEAARELERTVGRLGSLVGRFRAGEGIDA